MTNHAPAETHSAASPRRAGGPPQQRPETATPPNLQRVTVGSTVARPRIRGERSMMGERSDRETVRRAAGWVGNRTKIASSRVGVHPHRVSVLCCVSSRNRLTEEQVLYTSFEEHHEAHSWVHRDGNPFPTRGKGRRGERGLHHAAHEEHASRWLQPPSANPTTQ